MKTIGLIITDSIVTSLDAGLVANTYVVAIGTTALGNNKYQVNFMFYDDNIKTTKILAIYKNNSQIGQNVTIELGVDVEASTTSILQALKTYLETTYSWTITEDTI